MMRWVKRQLNLLTLTFLWWRVSVHDEAHRVLSRPYSNAFLVSTTLFLVSAFVPDAIRIYLWWASVAIALLLPLYIFNIGRNNPTAQRELDKVLVVSPSMVERFGLLTIIALGEVVVGVISGLSEHQQLTLEIGAIALLGMLIAVGLWWIYFDFVSHRIPFPKTSSVTAWTYLHLPLVASIAAVGAAVLNIIENSGEGMASNVRWLLVGGVSVALLCVALLINSVDSGSPTQRVIHIRGRNIMLIGAIATATVGLFQLSAVVTLGVVVVLLLAPIFFALQVWLERLVE